MQDKPTFAPLIGKNALYWLGGIGGFLLLLWLLHGILAPFIFGAVIAYFLDPIVDWLEEKGIKRLPATALVTCFALLCVALLAIIFIPRLFNEAQSFVEKAPTLIENLRARLMFLERFAPEEPTSAAGELGRNALIGLWSTGTAVFNTFATLIGAIVVAFYLLLDWDRMIAAINDLLPQDHAEEIRKIGKQIDDVLGGFLRGQLLVCAILGSFYAIALAFTGLEYGMLIGIFAGLVSFIPFVGSMTGFVLATGVALVQFTDQWWLIGLVAGIFVFGQLVEGNILTPKLVGESVGLHPVWLFFALAAFGTLFGFSGLMLAVPLAAATGVIARYGLEKYRESELYRGRKK